MKILGGKHALRPKNILEGSWGSCPMSGPVLWEELLEVGGGGGANCPDTLKRNQEYVDYLPLIKDQFIFCCF